MATLEIKTAEELTDPALEARWNSRRAARETDVLQRILRTFVERGGRISVEDIALAFQDRPTEEIHDALIALNGDDLIRVQQGHVDIAYPFSAATTPFVVRLPDGTERYACCAIDALGIAPMLARTIVVTSACPVCEAPLRLTVTPEGVAAADPEALGPEADGVMVWVGELAEDRGSVLDSL